MGDLFQPFDLDRDDSPPGRCPDCGTDLDSDHCCWRCDMEDADEAYLERQGLL